MNERVEGLDLGPRVASMGLELKLGPVGDAGIGFGHVERASLIVKPLAPGQQFVGKLVHLPVRHSGIPDGRHDLARTDDSEVKIRRQRTRAHGTRGVVARFRIGRENLVSQAMNALQRLVPSTRKHRTWRKRMVDRKACNQRIEVGVRSTSDPVGLKGQWAVVRRNHRLLVDPVRPLVAHLFMSSTKCRGRAYAFVECRRGHEASGIDREHRDLGSGGDPLGLPPCDESRLVLDDNRGGIGSEAIDQAFLALRRPIDILDAGQTAPFAIDRDVAARAQNEPMQAIGGIGVIFAEAVIDQHWKAKIVADQDRGVDHRIVIRPERLLQPAEHIAAGGIDRPPVECPHARRIAPLVKPGVNGRRHGRDFLLQRD